MIKELCEKFSPGGKEQQMRDFVARLCGADFDEIYTDNIGNLIAKRGGGGKLCIECGLDTGGVMVTSFEKGKATFAGFGGCKAENLIDRKIVFASGAQGVVRADGGKRENVKMSDLTAEIFSGETAVGEFAVQCAELSEGDAGFFANNLAERVGLAAVLKAVCNNKAGNEFTVLFSAQKCLGARGIRAFFGENNFDRTVTVGGCARGAGVSLGDGCVVVAKDKNCVSEPIFRTEIEKTASECKISTQTAVIDDNLYIENTSVAGRGTRCVGLGIPIGGKGKNLEYAARCDIDSTAELIRKIIETEGK